MKAIIIALVGAFYVSALPAQPLRPLPPLLRTFSDEVGALSIEESRQVARSAEEIYDLTGVRVIVVIAETTRPERMEDYAERLAQRWKRERQLVPERSILVVLAVREREFQVMPGKDLPFIQRELEASAAYAGLAPLFRESRYFEALMSVNRRLMGMILKHKKSS